MKAYIAKREYDYEGFIVLGVFSTNTLAEAACEKDKGDRKQRKWLPADGYSTEEFVVDET
jgi:hypothetical protein